MAVERAVEEQSPPVLLINTVRNGERFRISFLSFPPASSSVSLPMSLHPTPALPLSLHNNNEVLVDDARREQCGVRGHMRRSLDGAPLA